MATRPAIPPGDDQPRMRRYADVSAGGRRRLAGLRQVAAPAVELRDVVGVLAAGGGVPHATRRRYEVAAVDVEAERRRREWVLDRVHYLLAQEDRLAALDGAVVALRQEAV